MKKIILIAAMMLLLGSCAATDQAVSFMDTPTCTMGGCDILSVHSHMW